MCDPGTAGVALTAFSYAYQANAQYQQGKYQKGVAQYNTRVLENQAQEVRNEANEAENEHRQRVNQLISKQRAQLAANGIDLNSGSALQLQEDAYTLGEADALRIRSNYDSKIKAIGTESVLTQSKGDMAAAAGRNNAFGTLLSGSADFSGSGVADKWYTKKSAAKG